MTAVRIRPGESVEKALKILKKKIDKEGTMKEVKVRRFYRKPSVKKKEKEKAAQKNRLKRTRPSRVRF